VVIRAKHPRPKYKEPRIVIIMASTKIPFRGFRNQTLLIIKLVTSLGIPLDIILEILNGKL
jgi:hypothetical protein